MAEARLFLPPITSVARISFIGPNGELWREVEGGAIAPVCVWPVGEGAVVDPAAVAAGGTWCGIWCLTTADLLVVQEAARQVEGRTFDRVDAIVSRNYLTGILFVSATAARLWTLLVPAAARAAVDRTAGVVDGTVPLLGRAPADA